MEYKARYPKIPDAIYLKIDEKPGVKRRVVFKMPKPLKNRVYPDTPIVAAIKALRAKDKTMVVYNGA